MALDARMMACVVRVIGDLVDHSTVIGSRRGVIGSGFLVGVRSEGRPDVRYGYIVTAHHVIDGQNHVEVQIPDAGNLELLNAPIEVSDWRQPLDGVDLAIAPLTEGGNFMALFPEVSFLLATPHLGGQMFYTGILADLDRPMARSGTFGALDQTGIKHPGGYTFTAHLADCRSYGGFSGSPCFALFEFPRLAPETTPVWMPLDLQPKVDRSTIDYVVMFAGMVTAHLTDDNVPEASKYGVVIMLRALEIQEALMSKNMKEERQRWDADGEEAKAAATEGVLRTVGARATEDSEFERFESLARKLVNTPKPQEDASAQ